MENVREKEKENRDMRIDGADIDISIKDGNAILSGKVKSLQKKQLAEENALKVAGIDMVINQLEVEADSEMQDDVVRSFILTELSDNGYANNHQIEIDVADGYVKLKGLVNNYVERKKIVEIALNAPGVVGINNRIEVNRS